MPLPDERQTHILERLTRDGRVLAIDLAREFGTSEDTIRRDLRDLAAAGHCRRVYGGALPVSPASGSLAQRIAAAPGARAALTRAAAALVGPGQVALIDSGSTNLGIAAALPHDLEATVVTNAPAVASALGGRPRCTVILLGGRVHPEIGAAFGPSALAALDGVRADVVFVGACGLAPDVGLTVFDAEEAAFKRRLLARAARVVAVLTADKLGTAAPFTVAPCSALDDLVIAAETPDERIDGLDLSRLRLHRIPLRWTS